MINRRDRSTMRDFPLLQDTPADEHFIGAFHSGWVYTIYVGCHRNDGQRSALDLESHGNPDSLSIGSPHSGASVQ